MTQRKIKSDEKSVFIRHRNCIYRPVSNGKKYLIRHRRGCVNNTVFTAYQIVYVQPTFSHPDPVDKTLEVSYFNKGIEDWPCDAEDTRKIQQEKEDKNPSNPDEQKEHAGDDYLYQKNLIQEKVQEDLSGRYI